MEQIMGILRDKIDGPLAGEGTELFRAFSLEQHGLLSFRSTGKVFIRRPNQQWILLVTKREDDPIDSWIDKYERKRIKMYEEKPWLFVDDIPTNTEIDGMLMDGEVTSMSGEVVEPDGKGPDGAPSWLMAFGLI
jgi:hypothetical protein